MFSLVLIVISFSGTSSVDKGFLTREDLSGKSFFVTVPVIESFKLSTSWGVKDRGNKGGHVVRTPFLDTTVTSTGSETVNGNGERRRGVTPSTDVYEGRGV